MGMKNGVQIVKKEKKKTHKCLDSNNPLAQHDKSQKRYVFTLCALVVICFERVTLS